MSERYGYILTIEERYWNRFCRLNKAGKTTHAYVQSGIVFLDRVKLVFFYSVHPFKEVLGFAGFLGRKVGDSKGLWDSYGQETCLTSYDEYARLTRGKEKVTFIRFRNLHEASDVVNFDQVSDILQIRRMPQIGMYLNKAQTDKLVELLK